MNQTKWHSVKKPHFFIISLKKIVEKHTSPWQETERDCVSALNFSSHCYASQLTREVTEIRSETFTKQQPTNQYTNFVQYKECWWIANHCNLYLWHTAGNILGETTGTSDRPFSKQQKNHKMCILCSTGNNFLKQWEYKQ